MTKNKLTLIIFAALFEAAALANVGDVNEPVRYIGEVRTSNSDYKTGLPSGCRITKFFVQTAHIQNGRTV